LIATVQEGNTVADPAATPAQEPTATPAPASTETKPSAQEITDEEWKERLEAARERITKENTRKIEQREEKMNAAKSKVNELNRRFADWYYVISEADFNKLRVAQKDLVQPKTAAAGAGESGLPGGVSLPGLPIQP
jgi:succinate dehydrogenase/fumarate reductase flavoprotein subunit